MKIITFLPSSILNGSWNHQLSPTLSFPDSSVMKNGNPFFIPDFDSSFSGRLFTAVKITRLGKSIAPRFASRYYNAVAPVITIHADNLLESLRAAGLPWNIACGFDKSLVLGEFSDMAEVVSLPDPTLRISEDEEFEYPWPSNEEIADAIAKASMYNSLKMGDLILIPVDRESFPLQVGMNIRIYCGDRLLLKLPVK